MAILQNWISCPQDWIHFLTMLWMMSAFGLSMWGHVNAFVYDRLSKSLGLASSHIGIWVLFGWKAEFYSVEQILWYQTERGEPYSILLAPLASIGGDHTCVPLSLKGLSEATTRMPHRICSMWMTCANAMSVYDHAIELAELARVWNRGACDFPRALCKWIGPHVVEMEALLH